MVNSVEVDPAADDVRPAVGVRPMMVRHSAAVMLMILSKLQARHDSVVGIVRVTCMLCQQAIVHHVDRDHSRDTSRAAPV